MSRIGFLETVGKYLQPDVRKYQAQCIDIVRDVYQENTIKPCTRNCRGSGEWRQVRTNNILPKRGQHFLKHPKNKTELFSFLAKEIVARSPLKDIQMPPNTQQDSVGKQSHLPSTRECFIKDYGLVACHMKEESSRAQGHFQPISVEKVLEYQGQ
uniref:Uncharacterized protein n=1 Tax=Timema poppense TaxID=170557 RepID=A0A7R9D5J2_TIMPO|nr:unnamed protein product [Timema poppensis]